MTSAPELLAKLQAVHEQINLFGADVGDRTLSQIIEPTDSGQLSNQVVGLKDNIAVKGITCRAGMAHRRDDVAQFHAGVTLRLLSHGATIVPGLNMDEAALGGVTDNPHFGRTDNPQAPQHSTGGSSGGSAAAVASGSVDVALGTDTLGSVRIPASWCGVVGLKPTRGLIGRSGIVPLSPGLDTVGPIAKSAASIHPILECIAGADADDLASLSTPENWKESSQDSRLRIGVPTNIDAVECEAEVLAALDAACKALERSGYQIVPVTVPGWSPSAMRRAAFLLLEAEGAVALATDLKDESAFSPAVRKLLVFGRDVSSAKLVVAMDEIRRASDGLNHTLAKVDYLLTPTTPQRAIKAGGQTPSNQADFTAPANIAGLPAIAVPVNLPGEERPASVQLMGSSWSDWSLVHCAMLLEENLRSES